MLATWTKRLVLGVLLIFLACGGDPIQQGDQAFQQGKYSEAMKFYNEALKAQPDNPEIKKKIAFTYFKIGEHFFKTRRVIRAFEGQVEKGIQIAPDPDDPEYRRTLSQTYLALAQAYQQVKPENPVQKEQFFKKTLYYLEKAIETDSSNTEAQEALRVFSEKNFQEMLDRGLTAYKKGPKDPLEYLVAEYYLERALKFNPDHKEAKRYLRLARKKGLDVLNINQDMPIAISSQLKKGRLLAYYIVIRNNTDEPRRVSSQNFYLITADGDEVQGGTSREFAEPFQDVTLQPGQETGGVVTFQINPRVKYVRVEYWHENDVAGYKNLP
ncbi:MAG: DUF4352 domain-containing protein [Calditrichaeota bacterium]|nr:DUF4352 domain-containing protein [Calditrichota bacterium]